GPPRARSGPPRASAGLGFGLFLPGRRRGGMRVERVRRVGGERRVPRVAEVLVEELVQGRVVLAHPSPRPNGARDIGPDQALARALELLQEVEPDAALARERGFEPVP